MGKTIIKINRETIKPNPDYPGGFQKLTNGPRTITFKFFGDLYPFLKSNSVERYAYEYRVINNHQAVVDFLSEHSIEFSIVIEIRDSTTKAEDEYLYEYENTLCECVECKRSTPFDDIMVDSNEGKAYYICPECSAIDSFDIELERLQPDTRI